MPIILHRAVILAIWCCWLSASAAAAWLALTRLRYGWRVIVGGWVPLALFAVAVVVSAWLP